jgi:hypothetical protein
MVGCWPLTVDGGVKLSELMISAVHFFRLRNWQVEKIVRKL